MGRVELETFSKLKDSFKICNSFKCNSAAALQKCLVCDSRTDSKCISGPLSTNYKTCANYNSQCFTLISLNNIIRGCLEDAKKDIKEECEKDRKHCDICRDEDGISCNRKQLEALDSCIECDSNVDERCRTSPEALGGKICPQFESPHQQGCYLSIVSKILHILNAVNKKALFFIHKCIIFRLVIV